MTGRQYSVNAQRTNYQPRIQQELWFLQRNWYGAFLWIEKTLALNKSTLLMMLKFTSMVRANYIVVGSVSSRLDSSS